MTKTELSAAIKKRAEDLGFLSCGIAKVEFLEEEARHLEQWLEKGYHGKMSYMENHFDKRVNPALLVDDAKSVISVLVNYFPKQDIFEGKDLKISKYAYGKDYHLVIRERLQLLLDFIQELTGERSARTFTDSAPVLDKAWAERAGLGWIGKNGNLLSKKVGSFFFIGEIILDLELSYDQPITDHCGSCTKCIDACPTEAIIQPNVVDGSKCISYLTIELKDQVIPAEFKGQMENWVFGCDICQDVCPWNRFSKPHTFPEFDPHEKLSTELLEDMTEDLFREVFRHSAVKRTKLGGLRRNIDFIQ